MILKNLGKLVSVSKKTTLIKFPKFSIFHSLLLRKQDALGAFVVGKGLGGVVRIADRDDTEDAVLRGYLGHNILDIVLAALA